VSSTILSPAGIRAAAEGQFLGVDWGAFVVVFLVTLVAAVVVVTLYSIGLRLLAVGSQPVGPNGEEAVAGPRPIGATVGAYLCIALGIIAVLYGIYLIIPQFHK
jgi:hypothetical protein